MCRVVSPCAIVKSMVSTTCQVNHQAFSLLLRLLSIRGKALYLPTLTWNGVAMSSPVQGSNSAFAMRQT